MSVRRDNTLLNLDANSELVPSANYTVKVLPVGAVASGVSTFDGTHTTIPVFTGHGLSTGQKFFIYPTKTKFAAVTSTTSNTVVFLGSGFAVSAFQILVNMGNDTGTSTPTFDGTTVLSYKDPQLSNQTDIAALLTSDSTGNYGYWHDGAQKWECVRDTSFNVVAIYTDIVPLVSTLPTITSSTDNAVVRWDGIGGTAVQNSVLIVSDAGEVSGATSIAMGGALTGATTGAFSGAVTVASLSASGNVSAGGTLSVTGTSTLTGSVTATGSIAVGTTLQVTGTISPDGGIKGVPTATALKPYMCGTCPVSDNSTVAVTSLGNDTAPTNGGIWLGSLVIPFNCTVTGVQFLVGSVGGTDKVIALLYNSAGTLVASTTSGSAPTVATNGTVQQVAFSTTYSALGPGIYFLALQFNGTTARFKTIPANWQVGNNVVGGLVSGTFGSASTVSLPTTFTANQVPIASLY